MWSLKSVKDSSCCYNFVVGKDYVVGRKNADVMLLDDQSISRRHAVLTVVHPLENVGNPSRKSQFKVKDASSKYGTFKNNSRLEKEQEVVLDSDDIIKFGQFESSFKVCYTPLVVTSSCIAPSLKNEVIQVVHKLGGHLIPEWRPSCTHLLMSGVKVTVKALCCLMSLKHIINPSYLVDLANSFVNRTEIPKANDYLPPINEPMIDQEKAIFSVVEKRKTLFQNKRFIFLEEKQMKKLYFAVTMGGASAILMDENSMLDINIITEEQSCVIQPMGDKMNDSKFANFVKKLMSVLQSKKKRMIPECDFGLAVTYTSTEKFCNPNYLESTFVATPKIPQTFSQEIVYVPDTEDREQKTENRKRPIEDPLSSHGGMPMKRPSLAASSRQILDESQGASSNKRRGLSDESTSPSSEKGKDTLQNHRKIKREATVCEGEIQNEWDRETQPNDIPDVSEKHEDVEVILSSNNDEVMESLPLTDFTLKTNDKSMKNFTPGAITKNRMPLSNISFSTNASNHVSNSFHGKPSTISKDETSEIEDIPCNLIKIAIVDLVKRRVPLLPAFSDNSNKAVKNFKKFKKVVHAGANNLPKIIGGSDLVIRNATSSKVIDNWLHENAVGNGSESVEEAGEFDWDFPKAKRSRKK